MITETQKLEAEILRIGLICGCVSKDEVINWADGIILENDADHIFIEVSLSVKKSAYDIESLLHKISGEYEHFNACRRVLGRMAFICENSPESSRRFARGLYQIVVENSYDLPSDFSFLIGIDDEYALAESGTYGSIDEVDQMVFEDLKCFKSEQSALPDWYSAALNTNR